jgi:hypothetical protein
MDDLDFVKIDKEKYPLTYEAVHSGTLPLGTFFRKSGTSYFVYNDNWELWEEMLLLYPKESKEIAQEASRRTTYEKDLMSYFQFMLHTLPEYLEKNTAMRGHHIFREFVKYLLYRNLANYDSMVLLTSEKGTGKSSAAIMMARYWCKLIGIRFNPARHLAYNNRDVMQKIDMLNSFILLAVKIIIYNI